MEKRFVLFIVLSLATLTGYALVKNALSPDPPAIVDQGEADPAGKAGEVPVADGVEDEVADEGSSDGPADQAAATPPGEDAKPAAGTDTAAEAGAGEPPGEPDKGGSTDAADEAAAPADPAAPSTWPDRWLSLGSYRPGQTAGVGDGGAAAGGPPILVTWNSRGGSVERLELTARDADGKLRYRELLDRSGYLGHLAATRVAPQAGQPGGCRVNVVGAGTPAALATSVGAGGPGLRVGDVIIEIDGVAVASPRELKAYMASTRPKQEIQIRVRRESSSGSGSTDVTLKAALDVHPLQLIQPERPFRADESTPLHPSSFLMSILQVDDQQAAKEAVELKLDRSLRNDNWEVVPTTDGLGVEFRLAVTSKAADGEPVKLEVLKRFRLGSPPLDAADGTSYHLDYEIEIRNLSAQPHRIAYRLDGPNGLPLEGFWYSNKLHPAMFYVAGARDIVWKKQTRNGADVVQTYKHQLLSCSELHKIATKAEKKDKSPEEILFDTNEDDGGMPMPLYLAVDTQYFVTALLPTGADQAVYERAVAYVVGDVDDIPKGGKKATNVSFHLDSEPILLPAYDPDQEGSAIKQSFQIYAGPKVPELLAAYNLQDCIYYGWFGAVSKLLAVVLHFFYSVVQNYGLAIIMLTVLVRGGMHPLSRKAAKNAAMMQALAPQMKKITEKYKDDMEKRAKAQQELFKKHNYNPFGGCWMMFLQLPIFIGLYRTLSVDIDLRQASLLPGIQWCSNLAGPDMLFKWPDIFSWSLFTELGMLGPYFNILPMFTVALFLVQQKLFTPPPTDEQSRMQMTMMKYMTVFIGVMFFKVAAGLCIYFIASSLWGIAERKLLPKPKLAGGDAGPDAEPLVAKPKPKRPKPRLPDNAKSSRQQPRSKKKRR